MDIEHIIVDIQLINAYEGKRDRKWKDPKLAYISTLAKFREDTEQSEVWNFKSALAMPIGRRLIFDYAATTSEYKNHINFLRDIEEADKLDGQEAEAKVASLKEMYIVESGSRHVPVIATTQLKASLFHAVCEIFEDTIQMLKKDLSGCWNGFCASVYGWRLVQWLKVQSEPVTESSFHIYRVLGKGGFGEVFACMKKDSGHMYAVKCQSKKRLKKKNSIPYAWKERDVLHSVKSEFVVNLKYSYETNDDLCMVIDLMKGGDLSFLLKQVGTFPLEDARFLAAQLALGIADLHMVDIVYRDLKPENILLDEKGNLRISDLGLASVLPKDKKKKTRAGTPGYWAPEVILGEGYDRTVDWWGLGMVLYEMLVGRMPFRKNKETKRTDDNIVLQDIEYPDSMPTEAVEICQALLVKDYTKRLGYGGVEEIKAHPFFRDMDWYRLSRKHLPAPYIPPAWVNAKDIHDIDRFASLKDVKLEEEDIEKFSKFPLVVENHWQEEMLATVFSRVNNFDVDCLPNDLKIDELPPEKTGGFFRRFLGIAKRQPNKDKKKPKKAPTRSGSKESE